MKKSYTIAIALAINAALPAWSSHNREVPTDCEADSTCAYNSYRGLVMAGYQGWHTAVGDDAGRGFYHYGGWSKDNFRPGRCTIDLWPEVSEYPVTYPTPFVFENGDTARVYSHYDESTVFTHFRWMQEYGIDGVFMQRFVCELNVAAGKRHFDKVFHSAMKAALHHHRAICAMYDLTSMPPNGVEILLSDIDSLDARYALHDRAANPSYLWHNGKPLVAVWGVGFNDNRQYGYDEAFSIIAALKARGYSIMLGVPATWSALGGHTDGNPRLHEAVRACDIVMPWYVGCYRPESYADFHWVIDSDIKWCQTNGIDFAPLCFPGFSWINKMGYKYGPPIPRLKGRFFRDQLEHVIAAGAQMIYIAMFDEIDEGTAIYKCSQRVPPPMPGSEFTAFAPDEPSDLYLRIAGEAATSLKTSLATK